MAEVTGPNLAQDLRRIHQIITRGLDVSIENASRVEREGSSDWRLAQGYRSYVAALLSFLNAHHLAEDDVAFPYFVERLPDVPFGRLVEEHERMVGVIQRAQEAMEEMEPLSSKGLRDLEDALREIREMWHPHIMVEEVGFDVERLAEMLPPEEHVRLAGMMAQHSMQHSGPDYLVVPFALYNLPPKERAIMAAAMPPVVTEQMVPKTWKEQWAPMQPFLLE